MHTQKNQLYVGIRLPMKLHRDIQLIARGDYSSMSATIRRLLHRAIVTERQQERPEAGR